MTQPIQTHINAYYDELKRAKQAVAIAQGEVEKLEDQIRGRGGVVPGEEVETPLPTKEDTVQSDDVSAAEFNSKKGK